MRIIKLFSLNNFLVDVRKKIGFFLKFVRTWTLIHLIVLSYNVKFSVKKDWKFFTTLGYMSIHFLLSFHSSYVNVSCHWNVEFCVKGFKLSFDIDIHKKTYNFRDGEGELKWNL